MAETMVLQELKAKLPELRSALQPQNVILFGSQARGTATEDSDIDLIIVAESFRDVKPPNRHRPFFKILWRDRSVDLICLTPEEFEKHLAWPGVVSTANKEGIHLQ